MASPEAAEATARVLLVDDHAIVRRGLRSILELEPDVSVVREIGRELFVSESTAKFHVRNVMRKLGVHSRAEVVYAAGKRGLLDQHSPASRRSARN